MADLFSSPAAAVAGAGPATADAVAAAETEAISQQTASTERHPSALQAAALLPGAALSLRGEPVWSLMGFFGLNRVG
jgi:hypothetical protein